MNRCSAFVLHWATLLSMGLAPAAVHAATLTVGPGKQHATPCAAIAAAAPGDVIEIDAAGSYAGDVCGWSTDRLTLRGVNGRPKIDAAGKNQAGKGIWVIAGRDTVIENVELTGAKVPDQNGAGIRQEGSNLIVRWCVFHDNENGILGGGGADSEVLIEDSEFARNGFGDGYSHNMYIAKIRKFTLRGSYSHHARVGHNVKSRAVENHLIANRIMDEADGNSSYAIDLPNGGASYVIGNLLQHGPRAENTAIVSYGAEGQMNGSDALFVVNNTFVNDLGHGTFVQVSAATPAVVRNNVFLGSGTPVSQASAVLATNFTGDPLLVDRSAYDYRLRPGSPCIDKGSDPGMAGAVSLAPLLQYLHPAMHQERPAVGVLDIGAYELGAAGAIDAGATAMDAGAAAIDAPPAAMDTTAVAMDAGAAAIDTHAPAVDAGGSAGDDASGATNAGGRTSGRGGGCGCRLAPTQMTAGPAVLALLGWVVTRRRRRRAISASQSQPPSAP
jgi:MYXO-CTERM domain-containing protein